ncbi:MAG: hypothetical protein V4812_15885 [Pseudomonadota bacterium]
MTEPSAACVALLEMDSPRPESLAANSPTEVSLPMSYLFKKTLLTSALAALGGLLVSVHAQAVSLSQSGLGQVLIYPYYTVRGGHDTGVSVLNSTDQYKAVLVRFRESKNGHELTAFKLYLSPHDMWTAAITATADGAKLVTADKSCTQPRMPADGVTFQTFNLPSSDGESANRDRTREGYLEIIELGEVTNPGVVAEVRHVRHIAEQTSCNLQGIDMTAQAGDTALAPPSGGLTGAATLINVSGGAEYSYEPVILEGFSNVNLWSAEDTADLSSASPKASLVLNKGRAVSSTWGQGEDAVSAVLMHESLRNEVVLEPTTLSGTDWVVTMPTKHYYLKPNRPAAPFFSQAVCEYPYPNYVPVWDRETHSSSIDVWITGMPGAGEPGLCWASSVLTFNNANVLASTQSTNRETPYANGWTEIVFDQFYQQLVSLEGHVYKGLPVTGFMVHDFVNGNVNGLLSNYGGNFDHSYTTVIDAN